MPAVRRGNISPNQIVDHSAVDGNLPIYDNGILVDSGQTPGSGGGGGGLVLLEQHTASASASLDFTTAITSLYDEYQFEFVNLVPVSNGPNLVALFSVNGGSSYITGAHYFYGGAYRNASGGSGIVNQATQTSGLVATGAENNAAWGVCGTAKLFGALNASLVARLQGDVSTWDGSNHQYENFAMFYGALPGAINAIRFLFSSGNIASGIIRCYGIAK